MTDDRDILDLLARWNRQQESYIKEREERFDIMFEILAATSGEQFTIINAACGPGSLSQRMLERFPFRNNRLRVASNRFYTEWQDQQVHLDHWYIGCLFRSA